MTTPNAMMLSLYKTRQSLFFDLSEEDEEIKRQQQQKSRYPLLDIDFIIMTDESLIRQSESILRARGYKSMALSDAICITNKRI